jgi:hypothetical protein
MFNQRSNFWPIAASPVLCSSTNTAIDLYSTGGPKMSIGASGSRPATSAQDLAGAGGPPDDEVSATHLALVDSAALLIVSFD